jgi:hypothetical protein
MVSQTFDTGKTGANVIGRHPYSWEMEKLKSIVEEGLSILVS